jgi:hypothetical protein
VGSVEALGLDETLFFREGPRHLKQWCTSVVDVGGPDRRGKLMAGPRDSGPPFVRVQRPACWDGGHHDEAEATHP